MIRIPFLCFTRLVRWTWSGTRRRTHLQDPSHHTHTIAPSSSCLAPFLFDSFLWRTRWLPLRRFRIRPRPRLKAPSPRQIRFPLTNNAPSINLRTLQPHRRRPSHPPLHSPEGRRLQELLRPRRPSSFFLYPPLL